MRQARLDNYQIEDRGYSSPCWLWQGKLDDGYGRVQIRYKTLRAHRVIYEASGRTIPDGLTLDHLCRNKSCVNPDHLEPVTLSENTRRGRRDNPAVSIARRAKTHCKHGHAFTESNTYWTKHGMRQCRACTLARAAKRYWGAAA